MMKAVAATGALGSGFKAETLRTAAEGADFIGCDAGSSDPGPFYLGSGSMQSSSTAISRDLELMIGEGLKHRIPVLVGSAGTGGGSVQLRRNVEIIRALAEKNDWHFTLGIIDSEIAPETVRDAYRAGRLVPLPGAPEIDEDSIMAASHVVAMQGPESFQDALEHGADVVIAGRTSDTAIFAALPMMRDIPAGIAFHAAKILECGAAAAVERMYPDSMVAYLDAEGFVIDPPNPDMVCTPQSVASHVFYETSDPFRILEPGGALDTGGSRYEAISDRAVRVTGSRFDPADQYTVKLEAATLVGYRSVVFAGIRDPLLVAQIGDFVDRTKAVVQSKASDSLGLAPDSYSWHWSIYGKNGTLGEYEQSDIADGHEVAVLIDIVAKTQEQASAIAAIAWHTALHQPIPEYSGMVSQLAFPFSPPAVDVGPVYQFSLNHVMQLDAVDATYELSFETL